MSQERKLEIVEVRKASPNMKSNKDNPEFGKRSNNLIAKSFAFGFLVFSGVLLFGFVNYLQVDWYFPSFAFLIACFAGYRLFFEDK